MVFRESIDRVGVSLLGPACGHRRDVIGRWRAFSACRLPRGGTRVRVKSMPDASWLSAEIQHPYRGVEHSIGRRSRPVPVGCGNACCPVLHRHLFPAGTGTPRSPYSGGEAAPSAQETIQKLVAVHFTKVCRETDDRVVEPLPGRVLSPLGEAPSRVVSRASTPREQAELDAVTIASPLLPLLERRRRRGREENLTVSWLRVLRGREGLENPIIWAHARSG
jgi:hypothetical protein